MKRMIACFVTVSIMIGFMQAYAADDSVIVEDFENGMNLFAAVDNANCERLWYKTTFIF